MGTKRAPSTKLVEHVPARPYRRTPLWRRLLSFGELGILGVVLGALTAIVLATMVIGVFLVIDSATK